MQKNILKLFYSSKPRFCQQKLRRVYRIGSVCRLIQNFLELNHVSTEYKTVYNKAKSKIALAFLDENKNASYMFYSDIAEKESAFRIPDFNENDILLFGSIYALDKKTQPYLINLLNEAKKN